MSEADDDVRIREALRKRLRGADASTLKVRAIRNAVAEDLGVDLSSKGQCCVLHPRPRVLLVLAGVCVPW